ncbi:MAG: hypothetical protein L3J59_16475 [Methylococcaceae bacterium]|nr:hypothetical protein [Methylococcaceae bacterium]
MKLYADEHENLDDIFIEDLTFDTEEFTLNMLITNEELIQCKKMTIDEHELALTGIIHI